MLQLSSSFPDMSLYMFVLFSSTFIFLVVLPGLSPVALLKIGNTEVDRLCPTTRAKTLIKLHESVVKDVITSVNKIFNILPTSRSLRFCMGGS